MAYQNIIVETRGPVGLIRLNRPKAMNALNNALIADLGQALDAFEADNAIGAVVLTGNEKAFAAGADIKEMADKSYMDVYLSDFITNGWERITKCRKPIVAAVAGYALGGGCELALAADFRIAADSARFGLPEIKIGAFPGGGGTQRLTRLIGAAKAKEMILLGDPVSAQEALAIGLVTKVAAKEKYLREALELAEKLAALPRLALQASKMLINRSHEVDLATGLEFEARTFGAIAHTHDLAEGTSAFLEKRKANFTGH
jgi:enoyl-CoA hydratase